MFHTKNNSTPINRQAAVEGLIDAASVIMDSIWPQFNPQLDLEVLPLKGFIRETIRRSKSTFSVLQVALIYLVRIKGPLAKYVSPKATPDFTKCSRRMFIASLILASKFLQDKNYMNRAWAKIMGVKVTEINHIEQIFLQLIDYQLFVPVSTFTQWSTLLLSFASKPRNSNPLSTISYSNILQQESSHKATHHITRSNRYCPYPSPSNTPNPNTQRRFSVDEICTPQESPITSTHSPSIVGNKSISQLSIAYIVNPTEETSINTIF
ncbi:PHO85 cyclin-5 [Basidiobolus ranarum]|uniref:PHO85 cyclin-5 n=1 Tax=Basidiobolus ranarum TaxID=34480 RepID=A0ABR2X4W8_9FUNG